MAGLANTREQRRPGWGAGETLDSPIRLGVSSCLLGENVRFDGGHKRNSLLTDLFGRYFEWVPVCPEVEMGMSTPREAIRLMKSDDGVRLVAVKSGTDYTARMKEYAASRVEQLGHENLSGYVLKKDSPSCGVYRVRLYDDETPEHTGRGLFAEHLIASFPELPVEEEGRLSDPALRENFIERVFVYDGLKRLFQDRWTVGDLVAFHTAHKLTLLAHSPERYKALGRLVARAKELDRAEANARYRREFMEAMQVLATTKKHTNVLLHMHGYVSDELEREDRHELLGLIEDYRLGLIPLIVPVTLLRHHVRLLEVDYLKGQTYLEPHPKELMLRNHV